MYTTRDRSTYRVSIRPRVHTRGKRRPAGRGGVPRRVSIRPRVHTRGKPRPARRCQDARGGFNPPPSSHSGETRRAGRTARSPCGFNPPPSSHSGETTCRSAACSFARTPFQSAPEFTLGGNAAAGPGRLLPGGVSIRPRVHTRGKLPEHFGPDGGRVEVSIRPRVHTRGKPWPAAPRPSRSGSFNPPPSSHSGETPGPARQPGAQGVSIRARVHTRGKQLGVTGLVGERRVSIRPRVHTRGKHAEPAGDAGQRPVSIRPRVHTRGKLPDYGGQAGEKLFQSAPEFTLGGNVSRRQLRTTAIRCFNPPPSSHSGETCRRPPRSAPRRCFNPPPSSHSGETLGHPQRAEAGQVSIRPRVHTRGKHQHLDQRTVRAAFQSAPEFTLGGNELAVGCNGCGADVSIRPRVHTRGKRNSSGTSSTSPGVFQSAPEFTLGGNGRPRLAGCGGVRFQSAPEFTLGGNIASCSAFAAVKNVSIRPRVHTRGKRRPWLTARRTRCCFNPPPSSHSGETWWPGRRCRSG